MYLGRAKSVVVSHFTFNMVLRCFSEHTSLVLLCYDPPRPFVPVPVVISFGLHPESINCSTAAAGGTEDRACECSVHLISAAHYELH